MSTATRMPPTLGGAPAWAGDLEALMEAYRQAGGDPEALRQANVATLVVNANQVLISHEIEGVHFEAQELAEGIKARIIVDPDTKVERTIHLCFGMLPSEGRQEIIASYDIGAGRPGGVSGSLHLPQCDQAAARDGRRHPRGARSQHDLH